MSDALATVLDYHQRSKHSLRRYAAGPHGLDWANQPDPFRRYAGAPRIPLPLLAGELPPDWADLHRPGAIEPRPLTQASLAALLQLALGLAAWKQYGASRWALRCNPSSGNLHPTEGYVVVPAASGLAAGVYHYQSHDHVLERRCRFTDDPGLPGDGFLVGLSAIFWREAWKYGERAFRYCQHDAGHALAAIRYAAAVLGWRVWLLDGWSDDDIAALLGLTRAADYAEAEREQPELMLWVQTGAGEMADHWRAAPPAPLIQAAARGEWRGRANPLSPRHSQDWPVIDVVAKAAHKPRTPPLPAAAPPPCPPLDLDDVRQPATRLIRQRRSAQAFDGRTPLPAAAFFRLLDATLPRPAVPPLDPLPWPARLHLLLFVHRVTGLTPGLYALARRPDALPTLQAVLDPDYEWAPVPGCPDHLPLRRLLAADARDAARLLSCHQDIASDGAFSLAMLAEFEAPLRAGPWVYRQLYWEAGAIGQALYLQAEAAGARGTGIGCYFDDDVHALLGIHDLRLQDLYHFTVGAPLEDTRLQTLPAYGHLEARERTSA